MKLEETSIAGVVLVRLEKHEDERGWFARTYCRHELGSRGLMPEVVQSNLSFNRVRGTLRGMHAQAPPDAEEKLVQCLRGRIHDVALDLRPDSPTFLRHHAVELTAGCGEMLYLARGLYHGFQSLEDETLVHYQMSACYAPRSAVGFRPDDPAFGIVWPLEVSVISERDRNYPDFAPERLRG